MIESDFYKLLQLKVGVGYFGVNSTPLPQKKGKKRDSILIPVLADLSDPYSGP